MIFACLLASHHSSAQTSPHPYEFFTSLKFMIFIGGFQPRLESFRYYFPNVAQGERGLGKLKHKIQILETNIEIKTNKMNIMILTCFLYFEIFFFVQVFIVYM
jgi:hypothetical protein